MRQLTTIIIAITLPMFCIANTSQIGETTAQGIGLSATVSANHRQAIPDVMGYTNALETTERIPQQLALQTDDYTLYPGWPLTVTGNSFEGGIYCQMDTDPELEIVYCTSWTVHAWNLDGSEVAGWPRTLSHVAEGAPAYGDIDGDGAPEIVVGSTYTMTSGGIYAFELNGANVTGFPIEHGYASRTIVLADLDGDSTLEIITNKRMWPLGEEWVYRGDGTVYDGWPQPLGHVPASSAAVGDITGDGIPEIIGESYTGLYVWDINGNLLQGFPFMMPYSAVNSYSSPVLADIDDDGLREIIFGTHVLSGGGYVFALNHDGTQVPGWPKPVNQWIYGPPAVGYINDDAMLDICIGDQVLSPQPMDFVYAWDATGHGLPGFPIGPINAVNNQVALADLDNDGLTELMIDDNTSNGVYLAYNHDGTPLAGFPLVVDGTSFFNMPCITDLDGDGYINIVGASRYQTSDAKIYVWTSDVPYSAATIQIPMWQYNTTHDGVVPIAPESPPDVEVTLNPGQLPIIITTLGGSFDFVFRVDYHETPSSEFDGWMMIQSPDSHWQGPVMDPLVLLPMAPGSFFELDTTYVVEAGLDTGTYVFEARIGNYPSQIWDTDAFTFQIISDTTFVEDNPSGSIPTEFALLGNYPNPFNAATTLRYAVASSSPVRLTIYNVTGQKVATLAEGYQEAGYHSVIWNSANLASGVYIYQLQAGSHTLTQKIVLLR